MFTILRAALRDIAARRGAVMTLMLLPLLANVLAELNLTRALIATDYDGGTGASILAFWINSAAVVCVAVGWHRIILLDESVKLVPPARGFLYLSYFVSWVVIGFVIIAGLALVGVGLYFAFALLGADLDVLEGIYAYLFEVSDMMDGGATVMAVPIIVFLWFLFRCGVLLPNLALDRKYMSMRRAWVLTRPQAGAIAGVALIAGFLQSFAFALPVVFYESTYDLETGEPIIWAEYLLATVDIIVYTVSTLIGAAILTAIYKRIDPAELAQD